MAKNITPLLIILLIIASFLAGSFWTKGRLKKEQKIEKSAESEKPVAAANTKFQPKKTEKPTVKFFVMSFCPYGNQAENSLKPVAQALGDKVSWQPVYIVADAQKNCQYRCANSVYSEERCQQLVKAQRVPDMATCKKYFPYQDAKSCLQERCQGIKEGEFSSLHGQQELNQDVRELCAWKMGDQQKWWDFVAGVNKNCNQQNADSCWEKYARQAKLDTEAIKKCQKDQAAEILAEQLELVDQYQVQGSPTIYINEVLYQGGRQPEDYQQAICRSFEKPPQECGQALSSASSASSAEAAKQAPPPGSCK